MSFQRCLAIALSAVMVATVGVAAAGDWTANDVVTTLSFRPGAMGSVGLEVDGDTAAVDPPARHRLDVPRSADALSFMAPATFALSFAAPNGHFQAFPGGRLRHQGGFRLAWDGGSLALADFEVRPGADGRSLELADPASGDALLVADHLHLDLLVEGRRLQVFNADLRISGRLAERMGHPEYAGVVVGSLALDGVAAAPEGFQMVRGSCPDNWTGTVDVALVDMSSMGQADREGGQVVVVPSAELKNVGTADVPWYDGFSGVFPPYDNDQHPFLVWQLYRIEDGLFRQIGKSQVKHAFLTINSNCTGCGFDPHILGLGCEDVYGQGTNTSLSSLAPREEIEASTGIWAHCDEPQPNTPSHFDPDGDCDQDHFGQGEDDFTHGMVVEESDLTSVDPDVVYLGSAFYVVRDDVNIFNTMGWRTTTPSFNGFGWTFPVGPFANGSPMDAWIDPGSPEPGTASTVAKTANGHLQLGVRTFDAGEGWTRYEYVLMNHDYDPQVDALTIPVATGVTVVDPTFHDLDSDPTNDWAVTISSGSVSWKMPSGLPEANGLDWGDSFSFGFTADAAPWAGPIAAEPLEAASEPSVPISTLGPFLDPSLIFADGFESGDQSAW